MPDWDKAYRKADTALFGEAPTEFVRAIATRDDFTARSALCLADGDGRNGRWLATKGLTITAIDMSKIATHQARAKDTAAGVTVQRIVADLEHWQPAEGRQWDAAFVIFLQCEAAIRNTTIMRTCERLTPGGWLIAEGFAHNDAGTLTPSAATAVARRLGPIDPDLLYDLATLQRLCLDFHLVEATQGTVHLKEGIRHQGYATITRFAARNCVSR